MAEALAHRFTKFLLESNTLKFGDLALKSDRKSLYFINAGTLDDGKKIATLSAFYIKGISQAIVHNVTPRSIDTVFDPAYKGTPLTMSTTIVLTVDHNMTVGYTFDHGKKKDRSNDGWMIDIPLTDGMRVLLVSDVMTAGTTAYEVIPKLKAKTNVEVVGFVLSTDRMRKTKDSDMSAAKAVEAGLDFPVLFITNTHRIFDAAAKMEDPDSAPLLSHDI